jgi:hypothetical protein
MTTRANEPAKLDVAKINHRPMIAGRAALGERSVRPREKFKICIDFSLVSRRSDRTGRSGFRGPSHGRPGALYDRFPRAGRLSTAGLLEALENHCAKTTEIADSLMPGRRPRPNPHQSRLPLAAAETG